MNTATEFHPASGMSSSSPQGRSLAGLFSDLWRETTTLVHDEAELAKADVAEKVNQAITGARSMAVGGAILFAGFIIVLFAAVAALQMVLPTEMAPWLSPLIVGVVVMLIGFIAVSSGKKDLKTENLKPSRSMDSLRRDTELVREHAQ
jgi:primosomal replication protein N